VTVPAKLAPTRRRPVRRRTLLAGVGAAAASTTASCASERASQSTPAARPSSPMSTQRPRTLLAYFSRPGENYYYGGRRQLQVGNTEVVARLIAERLPVDVYRIEAADRYPADYEATVARNVREEQDDARPALASRPPALELYDVVLLGSPVWNLRAPMIMHTLLDRWNLNGKPVLPFVTYAVSGMGRIADEYAARAAGATIADGLAVQGEKAQEAGDDVDRWLQRAGLLTRG
jgi:flavodoxin